jgi:hypothetical protein
MADIESVIRHILIADDVRRNTNDPSKLDVFGFSDSLRLSSDVVFPYCHPRLAVLVSIAGGRGSARVRVAVVHADSDELAFRTVEQAFPLGDDPLAVRLLIFRIRDMIFPQPGLYWVQFWYNDKVIGQHPFNVKG